MDGRMVCIFIVSSHLSNATPGAAASAFASTTEEECLVGIGERIRWWSDSCSCDIGAWARDGEWRFATGTVVERTADTLIVAIQGASDTHVALSWPNVERLEVRRTRAATRDGALIGGVAGAVLGGLLSFAGEVDPCASGDLDCFEPMEMDFGMKELLIGGALGAGIGAAIGSQIRIPFWQDVECRLGPRIHSISEPGLQLALSF